MRACEFSSLGTIKARTLLSARQSVLHTVIAEVLLTPATRLPTNKDKGESIIAISAGHGVHGNLPNWYLGLENLIYPLLKDLQNKT